MTYQTHYQLTSSAGTLLSHYDTVQSLVRDSDEEAEMLMQARVRSGDYFMTLATELDQVAHSLAERGAPEAHELERLVAELLYVNQNFTVCKK